jgi:hypothetical protein
MMDRLLIFVVNNNTLAIVAILIYFSNKEEKSILIYEIFHGSSMLVWAFLRYSGACHLTYGQVY